MDISKLASVLHPLERKVLPLLSEHSAFDDLVRLSGLQDVEVMRALQWLQNKNIVKLEVSKSQVVELEENGRAYKEKGLPEIRFLEALDAEMSASALADKSGLSRQEVSACLGILRGKAAIEMRKEGGKLLIQRTDASQKVLDKDTLESAFLKKEFPLEVAGLEPQEKLALANLKKRKDIIKVVTVKSITARITEVGKSLLKEGISDEKFIERLTPQMLKSGSWKDRKFRAFDVQVNVPAISGGRRHFVNQAISYIKKVWLDLGFVEMTGDSVQTSLWDLDALFVPQDHPAREMQDTFFLKKPSKGALPELSSRVKAAHERGGDTGSKGWGGQWSEEVAKQLLLRTHTTVLSAKTIAKLNEEDLPAKFFAVGKVYRNEALDWKHLFEFYQVEGIVVDEKANLRHLFGYLVEFYRKLGYKDVRLRPAHFPYTEPSVEVEVLHPVKNEWVELGGAGILRPEVTQTLFGRDVPVLAWGQGLERGVTEYYDINDLRELYKNDLDQLKRIKQWVRV